ncbi:MAG: FkbM family methyltransferase [Chloroflexota bacterium]|nr:FkbM family methyltransferase [Chloroflexota bacterium]
MHLRKYPYYVDSIINLLTRFDDPVFILKIFLGQHKPESAQVRLRKSGLRFNVRGAMDIWSIKETFIDLFYERFGTPISDGWTIIDVGAGIGDFTIFAACQHPSNRVFAYEPYAQSFSILCENLRLNRLDNALVFAQAVSGQSGHVQLDTSGGEPLQIQSEETVDAVGGEDHVSLVPSVSLADVLAQNEIKRCDLLKLDCEGAEYAILFNTGPEKLRRIDRIVMEYHEGVTDYDHTDLERFLIESGYRIRITPNYVHNNLGYLYADRF